MWKMMLVLTVALLCCSSVLSLSCKDENGGDVDWYILYKPPVVKEKTKIVLTGLEYIYIHPQRGSVQYAPNTKDINAADGILANTLQPIFHKEDQKKKDRIFGYVIYNDQPAEGSAGHSFGHSKGLVMVDSTTGVWLLHSTPRFPAGKTTTTFWPDSGNKKGQTFICATFPSTEVHKIGNHLMYIRAHVNKDDKYKDHYNKDNLPKELQDVINAANIPPVSRFQPLTSSGGQTFYSVAKQLSPDSQTDKDKKVEEGDLYYTIATANQVKGSVLAQTWGCQAEKYDSYCKGPTHVENIQEISISALSSVKWKRTTDHSKWSVTSDKKKYWTCIADVNRGKTQFERHGGALCIMNQQVADLFRGFVGQSEVCSGVTAGTASKRRGRSTEKQDIDYLDCPYPIDNDDADDADFDIYQYSPPLRKMRKIMAQ